MSFIGSTSFFFMCLVNSSAISIITTTIATTYCSTNLPMPSATSSRVTSASTKQTVSPLMFFTGTPLVHIQP